MIEEFVENYQKRNIRMFAYCVSMMHLCVSELNYLKEEVDDYIRDKGLMKKSVKYRSNLTDLACDQMSSVYNRILKTKQGFDPVGKAPFEIFDADIRDAFKLERVTRACWKRHVLCMASIKDEILVVDRLIKESGVTCPDEPLLGLFLHYMRSLAFNLNMYICEIVPILGIDNELDFNDRLYFLDVLSWVGREEYDRPIRGEKAIEFIEPEGREYLERCSTNRFYSEYVKS